MVAGVFDELARERPQRRFTVGITDDVSRHEPAVRRRRSTSSRRRPCAPCSSASAPTARSARTRTRSRSSAPTRSCTRRATSSTTPRSPARRPSRTCASARSRSALPTSSQQASFVGCHQFGLLERVEVLGARPHRARRCCSTARARPDARLGRAAAPGPGADPRQAASTLYVIDAGADRRARRAWPGAPTRSCRPASSRSPACCQRERGDRARSRRSIEKTYGRRGAEVVARNHRRGRPHARRRCTRVAVPEPGDVHAASRRRSCPADAPEFVRTVTATMMAGRGDELPVSALPVDGTYPSGTTAYEKRNISDLVAVWDPELVHPVRQLQLRLPAQRDPLAVLRPDRSWTARPTGFPSAPLDARRPARRALHAAGVRRGLHRLRAVRRGLSGRRRRTTRRTRRSTSTPREPLLAGERENIAFFETLPVERPRRAWTSAPCAGRSSWSRCSSSPAPAPAAARRRT